MYILCDAILCFSEVSENYDRGTEFDSALDTENDVKFNAFSTINVELVERQF